MKTKSEQKQIRVTIEWDQYNHRRYSKPWIAKIIAWNGSEKPKLEWGQWLGTADEGGVLEIYASVGDIIRWGQKDYRKIHRSVNQYGIVREDGELEDVTPGNAKKHWIQNTKESSET